MVEMRDLVAAAEEARHHQPHHQVLAHDGVHHGAADLGVLRDASRGGAPRRDGVGIVEVHRGLSVAVGAHVGHPVGGVGKGLADLGLHQAFGLELRHRFRRAHVGQLHGALACLPAEVIRQRGVGADLRIDAAIERVHDAARRFRLDGVDGLVHHAQAELRRHRLAAEVRRLDGVARRFARLVLRLRGQQFHLQLVLRRRHRETLRSLVQLVAANENRRHVEVRRVLRLDGNIHRDAAAAALDHLPGVESVALRRHQH